MSDESVAELIAREVRSWPGVSVEPHRFGGVEFRVDHHEIGHLHGSRLADLPFPVRVREELVAAGRASPHHVLPETGWVSRYIAGPEDAPAVVALFRLNYDRIVGARARRVGGTSGEAIALPSQDAPAPDEAR